MHLKHFSFLSLVGYGLAQNSTGSLNATLTSTPQLSNLTSLLSLNPALLTALSSASNITILAPSNDAFSTFLSSNPNATQDVGLVTALLTYHVLNGTYEASQITNMSSFLPTMLTNSSYANVTGGQRVEAVMMGNEVLFYSGLLQNSSVTQADVNFTGGVVHIIDRVLTIPPSVSDTALDTNLTALRGAVNATNLTSVVDDTPNLTIFAPTNEAFQAIGSALQNLSTTDLASILAYHVVNGTVGYSSDLMNGTSLQTLNGGNVTITIENGTVFVNAARVVTPNVLVANGVVHVIDNVLNPNATTGPSASATSGAPGFTGASSASGVPFTSGQPMPTTMVNPTSAGAGPASTMSSSGIAAPMKTGAVGMGALFAGAGIWLAN